VIGTSGHTERFIRDDSGGIPAISSAGQQEAVDGLEFIHKLETSILLLNRKIHN
jgi:hypothetical protein